MNAALPYMDTEMREFAKRTSSPPSGSSGCSSLVLSKVDTLTETDYAELAVYAADEA